MKNLSRYIAVMVVTACFARPVQALEIPDYIVDINNPSANIDSIVEALTSNASNSAEAAVAKEHNDLMQRRMAAAVYAEALTTRVKLIQQAKDAEKNKKPVNAKDKKEVLARVVQPALTSIAERLNDIVSLEAAQSNLEGLIILNNLPRTNLSDEEDAAGEEE